MSIATISPRDLAALCDNGAKIELIDVRTPVEFQELHIANARNVPLDRLDPVSFMDQRRVSSQEKLYVICRSGGRGQQACEKFLAAGYANVLNIQGGTLACEQAGLPVVRGKIRISLERQVRIAAGSLVVLGVAFGWMIHPVFLALPAFVGAGLIFSGVTNTCGMGLLLARMPWNPSSAAGDACGIH